METYDTLVTALTQAAEAGDVNARKALDVLREHGLSAKAVETLNVFSLFSRCAAARCGAGRNAEAVSYADIVQRLRAIRAHEGV